TAKSEENASLVPSGEKLKEVGEPPRKMTVFSRRQEPTAQSVTSPSKFAPANNFPSGEKATRFSCSPFPLANAATTVRLATSQTFTPPCVFQPYPAAISFPSREKATSFTRSGQSCLATSKSEALAPSSV